MVTKKSIKKQRYTFTKKYVLWAIIVALVVLQGLSIWQVIKLQEYAEHDSNFTMRVLLRNAEEDRYKHPIIDVAENKVYIPEARIYLPLNETSRDLRYNLQEKDAGFWPKAIYFSTSSVVGKQTGAQYESCDRMATLALPTEIQSNGIKKIGTIEPTTDGLTDIFENSDTACWDQEWYTDAKQDLLDTIKQAKNY